MAIKIGDKVLVEGAACEVLRVRGQGDNLTCIVKIPDTGAEQQVRVTEADLVKGKGVDEGEDKGDEGAREDESSGKASGEGEGSNENESTPEDEPEPEPEKE